MTATIYRSVTHRSLLIAHRYVSSGGRTVLNMMSRSTS